MIWLLISHVPVVTLIYRAVVTCLPHTFPTPRCYSPRDVLITTHLHTLLVPYAATVVTVTLCVDIYYTRFTHVGSTRVTSPTNVHWFTVPGWLLPVTFDVFTTHAILPAFTRGGYLPSVTAHYTTFTTFYVGCPFTPTYLTTLFELRLQLTERSLLATFPIPLWITDYYYVVSSLPRRCYARYPRARVAALKHVGLPLPHVTFGYRYLPDYVGGRCSIPGGLLAYARCLRFWLLQACIARYYRYGYTHLTHHRNAYILFTLDLRFSATRVADSPVTFDAAGAGSPVPTTPVRFPVTHVAFCSPLRFDYYRIYCISRIAYHTTVTFTAGCRYHPVHVGLRTAFGLFYAVSGYAPTTRLCRVTTFHCYGSHTVCYARRTITHTGTTVVATWTCVTHTAVHIRFPGPRYFTFSLLHHNTFTNLRVTLHAGLPLHTRLYLRFVTRFIYYRLHTTCTVCCYRTTQRCSACGTPAVTRGCSLLFTLVYLLILRWKVYTPPAVRVVHFTVYADAVLVLYRLYSIAHPACWRSHFVPGRLHYSAHTYVLTTFHTAPVPGCLRVVTFYCIPILADTRLPHHFAIYMPTPCVPHTCHTHSAFPHYTISSRCTMRLPVTFTGLFPIATTRYTTPVTACPVRFARLHGLPVPAYVATLPTPTVTAVDGCTISVLYRYLQRPAAHTARYHPFTVTLLFATGTWLFPTHGCNSPFPARCYRYDTLPTRVTCHTTLLHVVRSTTPRCHYLLTDVAACVSTVPTPAYTRWICYYRFR